MRIEVDPGGLEAVNFGNINQEVTGTVPKVTSGLEAASPAAGNGALAAAIDDLVECIAAADTSAALSVTGLASAVGRAGASYRANEAGICRAETQP